MQKPIALSAKTLSALLCLLGPALADEPVPQAAQAAASQIPQAVRDACKDDYEKHCAKHEPESDAGRDCMAQAFQKLSDGCVTAILDSPLVDEQKAAAEETAKAPQSGDGKTVVSQAPAQKAADAQPAHTAAPNPKHRVAHAAPSKNAVTPKAAKRTAEAKPSKRAAKTHVAQHAHGPQRSVAEHIRRGTGIANYYVAKYTRFALAKAFR